MDEQSNENGSAEHFKNKETSEESSVSGTLVQEEVNSVGSEELELAASVKTDGPFDDAISGVALSALIGDRDEPQKNRVAVWPEQNSLATDDASAIEELKGVQVVDRSTTDLANTFSELLEGDPPSEHCLFLDKTETSMCEQPESVSLKTAIQVGTIPIATHASPSEAIAAAYASSSLLSDDLEDSAVQTSSKLGGAESAATDVEGLAVANVVPVIESPDLSVDTCSKSVSPLSSTSVEALLALNENLLESTITASNACEPVETVGYTEEQAEPFTDVTSSNYDAFVLELNTGSCSSEEGITLAEHKRTSPTQLLDTSLDNSEKLVQSAQLGSSTSPFLASTLMPSLQHTEGSPIMAAKDILSPVYRQSLEFIAASTEPVSMASPMEHTVSASALASDSSATAYTTHGDVPSAPESPPVSLGNILTEAAVSSSCKASASLNCLASPTSAGPAARLETTIGIGVSSPDLSSSPLLLPPPLSLPDVSIDGSQLNSSPSANLESPLTSKFSSPSPLLSSSSSSTQEPLHLKPPVTSSSAESTLSGELSNYPECISEILWIPPSASNEGGSVSAKGASSLDMSVSTSPPPEKPVATLLLSVETEASSSRLEPLGLSESSPHGSPSVAPHPGVDTQFLDARPLSSSLRQSTDPTGVLPEPSLLSSDSPHASPIKTIVPETAVAPTSPAEYTVTSELSSPSASVLPSMQISTETLSTSEQAVAFPSSPAPLLLLEQVREDFVPSSKQEASSLIELVSASVEYSSSSTPFATDSISSNILPLNTVEQASPILDRNVPSSSDVRTPVVSASTVSVFSVSASVYPSVSTTTDVLSPTDVLSVSSSSKPSSLSASSSSAAPTFSSLSPSPSFASQTCGTSTVASSRLPCKTMQTKTSPRSARQASGSWSRSTASVTNQALNSSSSSCIQLSSTAPAACLSASIQSEVETATRRLEMEKRKLEVLVDSLQRSKNEYDDKRVRYANVLNNINYSQIGNSNATKFGQGKTENKIKTKEVVKAELQVQIIKRHLNKDLSKFNIYMHDRSRIIQSINQLRRERVSLNKVHKRLTADLNAAEKEEADLISTINTKDVAETNLIHKIRLMKEQRDIERRYFKDKVCELQALIDQQSGLLKQTVAREHSIQQQSSTSSSCTGNTCSTTSGICGNSVANGSSSSGGTALNTSHSAGGNSTASASTTAGSGDNSIMFNSTSIMKNILRIAFLNSIQRRLYKLHQQTIMNYTEAKNTIKSATGIYMQEALYGLHFYIHVVNMVTIGVEDIDQIVDIFQTLEERNYSLITFINNAANDLHAMKKKQSTSLSGALCDTMSSSRIISQTKTRQSDQAQNQAGPQVSETSRDYITSVSKISQSVIKTSINNDRLLTECLPNIESAYKVGLKLVENDTVDIPNQATSLQSLSWMHAQSSLCFEEDKNNTSTMVDSSRLSLSKNDVPTSTIIQIDTIIPLLSCLERIVLSCSPLVPNGHVYTDESGHCLGFPTPAAHDNKIHLPRPTADTYYIRNPSESSDDEDLSERPLTLGELKTRSLKLLHKSNNQAPESAHVEDT